jgi:hypothetical protein
MSEVQTGDYGYLFAGDLLMEGDREYLLSFNFWKMCGNKLLFIAELACRAVPGASLQVAALLDNEEPLTAFIADEASNYGRHVRLKPGCRIEFEDGRQGVEFDIAGGI